ncbi:hypothetical protein MNBD_BACTEROID03-383 [hydrothermal vent metagenome]|uniref:Lipoprotein n=1 Tax=hydrothermal vent metagenome TaxID=652676 RepID=A0A3B0T4E5_9ZZZZ
MKKKLSVLLAFTVLVILFSCDKGGDNSNCSECEGGEITICDLGNGKAVAKGNGKEVEVTYNDGSDWDVVVAAACDQFSTSSSCYECDGPNVEVFDICKTEDGITVNGKLVKDTKTTSLEDAVAALEANETNEEVFENLACQKK